MKTPECVLAGLNQLEADLKLEQQRVEYLKVKLGETRAEMHELRIQLDDLCKFHQATNVWDIAKEDGYPKAPK